MRLLQRATSNEPYAKSQKHKLAVLLAKTNFCNPTVPIYMRIPVYMDSEFEGIRTEVRQYSGSSSVLFDRRQKNNIFDYYFRF
jgi:hypothetical protein